ncbi:MAG: Glu/Leu/Phe/Val dehydrogenase [Gammaproteobacteria bacterium]|nr:Glu/Leu/Phe/Val dehydrogenase [Gammaproteobacteria bacterium]MYH85049.1 Glu/Leu/Phe/Val dehydrogenase [Gammaproteobacteria bacterium]MYK05639.1 Glu/Leu/Phe/Val dehydrogenase [Gammaproteobacteria bacterium]
MSVFSNQSFSEHELVAFRNDRHSGLQAIIAVHSSALGPAVGGCRMYPYASEADALHDVLRLSRGMTHKSALAGLPFGGGKSIIIGDPHKQKNRALLEAMGDFVNSLGGRYITAEDVGTSVADIRTMARRTPYVAGLDDNEHGGDPSPSTAYGVFLGIRTAVRHRYGRDKLDGIGISIQGLGHVGFKLARLLIEDGATVYGADINAANLERAAAELGVRPVSSDEVLLLPVDVVAPCAMGAIWNRESISRLRAGIVCGAANNQLSTPADGELLRRRGVLYCPDFLVNAGGIIEAHHQILRSGESDRLAHIGRIETTLAEVLRLSGERQVSTESVAREMAEDILRGSSCATEGADRSLAA